MINKYISNYIKYNKYYVKMIYKTLTNLKKIEKLKILQYLHYF